MLARLDQNLAISTGQQSFELLQKRVDLWFQRDCSRGFWSDWCNCFAVHLVVRYFVEQRQLFFVIQTFHLLLSCSDAGLFQFWVSAVVAVTTPILFGYLWQDLPSPPLFVCCCSNDLPLLCLKKAFTSIPLVAGVSGVIIIAIIRVILENFGATRVAVSLSLTCRACAVKGW